MATRKPKAKAEPKIESTEAISTYLKAYGRDGWMMLKPAYLLRIGFSPKLVKRMTTVEKSSKSDPKGQLYDNDGRPVDKIEGVYSLAFSYAIAHNVGADTTEAYSKMGRGFQAQCLTKAIATKLGLDKKKEAEDGDRQQDTGSTAEGTGDSDKAVADGKSS